MSDPAFLRCLRCGADRQTSQDVCPACGSTVSALVVVGWSVEEAKRGDRVGEWKRSIAAFSWATKAGFLAAAVAAAIVAGTLADGFTCAVVALALITWAMASTALQHARRPPFEDHARGDVSWMFAGPWVYAHAQDPMAEVADAGAPVDEDDDEDAWFQRSSDARIRRESVTSVDHRPSAMPGFQRLSLRVDREGTALGCHLEFAITEAVAEELLARIRTWFAIPASELVGPEWTKLAVDPRSDSRLAHVGSNALVLRCTPRPYLELSVRKTDRACGAFARCVVFGLITLVPISALVGCLGATLPVIAASAGLTLAAWLAIAARCALAARARWLRGGARFLVIEDRAVALAQDVPDWPMHRGPATATPGFSLARPDRRAEFTIALVPAAREGTTPESIDPPVSFATMDAPNAWGLSEEISRRLRG